MGGGSIIKKVAEHKKKIAGADRIRKSGGSIRKKSLPKYNQAAESLHWAEQCPDLEIHWLALTGPNVPPSYPYAFLQLHRLAVRRAIWSRLVGLPTCKKLLRSTAYQAFSQ